jgi:hypothetical protein
MTTMVQIFYMHNADHEDKLNSINKGLQGTLQKYTPLLFCLVMKLSVNSATT